MKNLIIIFIITIVIFQITSFFSNKWTIKHTDSGDIYFGLLNTCIKAKDSPELCSPIKTNNQLNKDINRVVIILKILSILSIFMLIFGLFFYTNKILVNILLIISIIFSLLVVCIWRQNKDLTYIDTTNGYSYYLYVVSVLLSMVTLYLSNFSLKIVK